MKIIANSNAYAMLAIDSEISILALGQRRWYSFVDATGLKRR
jgi:hypothetical protein